MIRALRAEILKLTDAIRTSVPALAKALETARKGILLLRYSWLYHTGAAKKLDESIQAIQPDYARYLEIRKLLREKSRKKKELTAELKTLNPLNLMRRAEIKKALATITEDMEELRSEMDMLIAGFGKSDPDGMKEIKQQLDALNASKAGLEGVATKAADALDAEVQKYHALQEQSKAVDANELHTARMELRVNMTAEVRENIRDTFGKHYDADRFRQADREVSELLGEPHPQKDHSITTRLLKPSPRKNASQPSKPSSCGRSRKRASDQQSAESRSWTLCGRLRKPETPKRLQNTRNILQSSVSETGNTVRSCREPEKLTRNISIS